MMPACKGFYPLVPIVLVNQTVEDALGEEAAQLSEHVLAL